MMLKHKSRFEALDVVIFILLTLFGLLIVIPFYNAVVVSLTTQKEYLDSTFMLIVRHPTLESYGKLFGDQRIWIGFKTTLLIVLIGVPVNLLLTSSLAYGLSRRGYPGRKPILMILLFTMIFNGGIIPLYMLMRDLKLTNQIWSVIFAYGVNTFYMLIIRNYFMSLPESLIESAKLDGAGEWRILFKIILPLSMPIVATFTLFYTVDRWNEWYNAMIFIRKSDLQPLQLVLRNIIINAEMASTIASSGTAIQNVQFTTGIKMAAVMVTMLPVMCVFPFLQKHFVKGILVGAIKS